MSSVNVLAAALGIVLVAFPSALVGGVVASWLLRRVILSDIRAEKAGDLAE